MIYFDYPAVILLIIPIIFIIVYYTRPKGKWNIFRLVIKLIVIILILLSIASPYTFDKRTGITGSNEITIIADNTDSMRIYDPDIPNNAYDFLSNRTSTNIDFISGSSSSIGDAILRNMRPGGNILLVSDGNNNHGKSIEQAVNFARNINSTIYYLRQDPEKDDIGVSVTGDGTAIVDAPFDFYIDINMVGNINGELKIYIDDNIIDAIHLNQSRQIPVEYTFNTPGSHRIKAEISGGQDEISQNNIFYKSVFVISKPEILLVSRKESPLSRMLDLSYTVDFSSDLKNPDSYKAVIIDDIDASGLSDVDTSELSDYVVNGGGLLIIGGPNSYKNDTTRPILEQLIPVRPGGADVRSKRAAVILVIDISGSTGDLTGDSAKLGIEKGLAYQVIESLSNDDFIGLIAFNNAPHTIVPISRYTGNPKIKDTISRLKSGGTTHLVPALSTAFNMIGNFDSGKNVIVISDGNVADAKAALDVAGKMAEAGIDLYTIGVGLDTDEVFMKNLAAKGGGIYMKRDQTHGIELLFGEITEPGKINGFPLVIINNNHFITEDVLLNATIYGYNSVFKKQNAQALVMTVSGNPVISSWRFGLGRVVSIATDNGDTWAQELYNGDNSKIISSSVNYAIGNPRKNDRIMIEDGETGEPLYIRVLSSNEPDITFDGKPLQFDHTQQQHYTAAIIPESQGFKDISGFSVAVNSPVEYRKIGNNDLLPEIITASGGKVYNITGIDRLIPDISRKNTSIIEGRVELFSVFLLTALLLYSIDIILRRLLKIIA